MKTSALWKSVALRLPSLLLAFWLLIGTQTLFAQESPTEFIKQHCVACHNAKKDKGGVELHELQIKVTAENKHLWIDVVEKMQRGEMPPEDEPQPSAKSRQSFIKAAITQLDRYRVDSQEKPDPLMRLTNQQIGNSLRDILGISLDISGNLIGDPVDKHGYSVQSELDISAGYLDLYLPQLDKAIGEAMTPSGSGAVDKNTYRLAGSDWEKSHYLTGWGNSKRSKRKFYRGPKYLGDAFEIPLPAKHEYRMYIKDNRPEGDFRIRVTLRNEPPTDGGKATEQEVSIYLDEGFMRPYKLVKSITVPVKKGPQHFELFGNVRDWVGVDTSEEKVVVNEKGVAKGLSRWRTLSIQNNNKLVGFPQPTGWKDPDRYGKVYLVRPDDQWIKAFGELHGLQPSYLGPAANHPGGKGKKPAIYNEVMKTHGYVVVEQVEFDLPFRASSPVLDHFQTKKKFVRSELPAKLRAFAARAWRRPLDEELSTLVNQVIAEELKASKDERAAIHNALVVILSDPNFLYLSNGGTTVQEKNFELISKLSYFLWDSPPDKALLKLAYQKEPISNAAVLQQVNRMLTDSRCDRFMKSFVANWIGFAAFDQIAIDPGYYSKWRPSTKPHLKGETIAFFQELLKHDLSCLNILDSDFIMANDRVGEFYGIEGGVAGKNFSRVPAPKGRGGVLTQAAVLLAGSDGQDAHAVLRGVWLRSRILGNPVSDPPAGTGSLADQNPAEVDLLSIKDRFKMHLKGNGACYDCHKDIDHWGIAMEGFDATGMPRSTILKRSTTSKRKKKLPVFKEVTIDDKKVNGMADLKKYLREHKRDEFAAGFTRHMLSHALGRPLTYHDEKTVTAIAAEFSKGDYKMKTLIKTIVTSPTFQQKETAQ